MNKNFKKIISLVLTVLMLAGTMTMLVPASAAEASKTLTTKTEHDIKGVKVRLDVPSAHVSSSLTLCPDGSVKMKGSRGDLFWLSNVELTADSVFTTTVTFDAAKKPGSCCAGTAYGIYSGWDESADTAIVAALRTNGRRSIALTNYGIATKDANFVTPELSGTLSYTVSNEDFGGTWQLGKTVTTVISQNNGTVTAKFTDGNGIDITSASYTNSEHPLGGNVGYMTHWTDGSDYNEYTISEFKVTNAIVNGVLVEELDLIAEVREYMNPTKGVTDEAISLSLDGTIGLNFAFNADAGVPAGATVVATMNGKVVAEQAVVNGANIVTAPVNAKEMNDDVNFAIMVDGEVYDNHSYTVSVAEYAAELKKNAEWTSLMDAMLNYGAAAQKLLNYKADGVVVADSSFDMSAIQDITFNGNKALLDGLYMNLSLESDTVMNLYFKPAEGVTLNVTVNGEAVELVDNGDGYYVATIKGIAADELADGALIVVNGDLSFTCSALNWAKIASADANADVANVAKALAVYANEAASKN